PNLLPLQIQLLEISLGEGNLVRQLRTTCDHQQRRFSRTKLHVFNFADLALAIEYRAADQVAQVRPARLRLGALVNRKLKFRAHQRLGIGNRLDALKLQYQKTLMRPQILDRHFAALAVLLERPQPHVSPKALRNSGVQLNRYFPAASLGLDDD